MGRTYDRTHLQSASNPNYNFFVDVKFSDDDLRTLRPHNLSIATYRGQATNASSFYSSLDLASSPLQTSTIEAEHINFILNITCWPSAHS